MSKVRPYDFSDLLPDAWMQAQANNPPTPS
jgi:hypothetical protein